LAEASCHYVEQPHILHVDLHDALH